MQLRTNASVHAPGSDVEHKDNDAIATSGEGSSDSETSLTCSEELCISPQFVGDLTSCHNHVYQG